MQLNVLVSKQCNSGNYGICNCKVVDVDWVLNLDWEVPGYPKNSKWWKINPTGCGPIEENGQNIKHDDKESQCAQNDLPPLFSG